MLAGSMGLMRLISDGRCIFSHVEHLINEFYSCIHWSSQRCVRSQYKSFWEMLFYALICVHCKASAISYGYCFLDVIKYFLILDVIKHAFYIIVTLPFLCLLKPVVRYLSKYHSYNNPVKKASMVCFRHKNSSQYQCRHVILTAGKLMWEDHEFQPARTTGCGLTQNKRNNSWISIPSLA